MSIVSSAEMLPLVTRLQAVYNPSHAEIVAIRKLDFQARWLMPGNVVASFGARPVQCCVVLEGVLARSKTFRQGQRQIMAFHLPGDIPDILGLHLSIMDHDLTSLVHSRVAFIQHDAIRRLVSDFPRLGAALWKESMIESAISREWMARNCQVARRRLAHLLCELTTRMDAVDLFRGDTVVMPLTQQVFSEALSLSVVHVNRVIQELRSDNLISWHRHSLKILNWERLRTVGEFDPVYLHLGRRNGLNI